MGTLNKPSFLGSLLLPSSHCQLFTHYTVTSLQSTFILKTKTIISELIIPNSPFSSLILLFHLIFLLSLSLSLFLKVYLKESKQGVRAEGKGERLSSTLCARLGAWCRTQSHDPAITMWAKLKSPMLNQLSHPVPSFQLPLWIYLKILFKRIIGIILFTSKLTFLCLINASIPFKTITANL